MALIQKSFIQERSLPIITFIGRPTDSKKGLVLFLDALEMLASLSMIENFITWIIGGDDNETKYVLKLLESYTLLKSKYEQGAVMVWGRVENDALPELLSRSCVLVMPSYREQFGMVAVEAMLCGCPVIGAKVGGLNDLIIPQKTGFLFERGNSMALCAVLSGFLRNKPEKKRMRLRASNWAKGFSQDKTFSAITKVYYQRIDEIPNFWDIDHKKQDVTSLVETAEEMINQKVFDVSILHSHGKHVSIKITTEKGVYFVKKINEHPSSTISVFPIDFDLYPNPKSTEERFLREIYQIDNPHSPKIIKYDIENSVLITEYHSIIDIDLYKNPQLIIDLLSDVRQHKLISDTEPIMLEYYEALTDIRNNPSLACINRFDKIASSINQRITKELLSFTRLHPHVELYRLKIMITQQTWILPPQAKDIFLNIIDYLEKNVEFNNDRPTLAHGDMKEEHFLKSDSNDILLCDWEHSKFCVGPWDETIMAFKLYNRNKNHEEILEFLMKLFPDNRKKQMESILWLVNQIIFASIYWYTQGNNALFEKGYLFLKDFISPIENLCENKSINP